MIVIVANSISEVTIDVVFEQLFVSTPTNLIMFDCCRITTMDQLMQYIEPAKQFSKDSIRLVKRCTKPDRKGKF